MLNRLEFIAPQKGTILVDQVLWLNTASRYALPVSEKKSRIYFSGQAADLAQFKRIEVTRKAHNCKEHSYSVVAIADILTKVCVTMEA